MYSYNVSEMSYVLLLYRPTFHGVFVTFVLCCSQPAFVLAFHLYNGEREEEDGGASQSIKSSMNIYIYIYLRVKYVGRSLFVPNVAVAQEIVQSDVCIRA